MRFDAHAVFHVLSDSLIPGRCHHHFAGHHTSLEYGRQSSDKVQQYFFSHIKRAAMICLLITGSTDGAVSPMKRERLLI